MLNPILDLNNASIKRTVTCTALSSSNLSKLLHLITGHNNLNYLTTTSTKLELINTGQYCDDV